MYLYLQFQDVIHIHAALTKITLQLSVPQRLLFYEETLPKSPSIQESPGQISIDGSDGSLGCSTIRESALSSNVSTAPGECRERRVAVVTVQLHEYETSRLQVLL